MPTTFVTQDKVILWTQPDGPNTAAKPVSIDKNGMVDKTMPGPGRNVIWGRDAFSRFLPKIVYPAPPGGLNTSTVEEDDYGTWSFLKRMFDQQGCFPLQERWYKCGRLDGPAWTRVLQYGRMTITQEVHSAGPNRAANAEPLFNTFAVSWPYTVELYQHALSSLTIAEDQNINDIAVLSDLIVGCNNCFPGYSPDHIMYLAVNANAGSPGDYANIWYSTNGGGTWAITSTNPLASNSDRAWKVEKAIENYAKPLGFDTNHNKPEKSEWLVYYDENFHSHMNEFKLRTEIQNHPIYQAKSQEALGQRDAINREYGIVIRQLKNLISALEARNQKELDNISQELIATQLQILNSLEIPEVLNEQDRKFLFEPNYPITKVEMDHYNNYGQGYSAQGNGKLPTDLNLIMALLD